MSNPADLISELTTPRVSRVSKEDVKQSVKVLNYLRENTRLPAKVTVADDTDPDNILYKADIYQAKNDADGVDEFTKVIISNTSIINLDKSERYEVGDHIKLVNVSGTFFIAPSNGETLPTGEYQYQGYYMVSQNQAGWDFVRAHPII